jgi:hypothetical protein
MLDPQEIILELHNFQTGLGTLDDTWTGHTLTDNNLWPLVPFWWGPYWPRIETFPSSAVLAANGGLSVGMNAMQQIEDSVRMPQDSFLVALSSVSPRPEGFRYTIFDVGRNDWVETQKWRDSRPISTRAKPWVMIRPYPLVDAGAGWGKLVVRMVNASPLPNDCQLALHFCVAAGQYRKMLDPGKSWTTRTGVHNW